MISTPKVTSSKHKTTRAEKIMLSGLILFFAGFLITYSFFVIISPAKLPFLLCVLFIVIGPTIIMLGIIFIFLAWLESIDYKKKIASQNYTKNN